MDTVDATKGKQSSNGRDTLTRIDESLEDTRNISEDNDIEDMLIASMRKRVELTVKMLRKSKGKHNNLSTLSMQDASKVLIGFTFIVAMCEALEVDCSELIAELNEVLEQYPELWVLIDDSVEKVLTVA